MDPSTAAGWSTSELTAAMTWAAAVAAVLGGLITAFGVQWVAARKAGTEEALALRKLALEERQAEQTRSLQGYEMLIARLDKDKQERKKEYQEIQAKLMEQAREHDQCRRDYAALLEKHGRVAERVKDLESEVRTLEEEVKKLRGQ